MTFGDGMFHKLFMPFLKRTYPCIIDPEDNRSSKQKEVRIINNLEPILNQHRLIVSEDVIKEDLKVEDKYYQLMYQLTRITKDRGSLKHDDRLDALSMAVEFWINYMDKDVEDNISEQKEKLQDIEIEKFMENALGYSSEGDNYLFNSR